MVTALEFIVCITIGRSASTLVVIMLSRGQIQVCCDTAFLFVCYVCSMCWLHIGNIWNVLHVSVQRPTSSTLIECHGEASKTRTVYYMKVHILQITDITLHSHKLLSLVFW